MSSILQQNTGSGSALGNNGNNSGQQRRNEALRLREILWRVSSIEDFRKCGRVPNSLYFPVVETPHGFRLRGFCRCHSIWCCPICAPEIRAARGAELSSAVSRHLETGSATFGSATVPHGISDALKNSLSVVMKAWDRMNTNRAVQNFRTAHGWLGFCRACEVTHGPNGWHPHLHWIDFWSEPLGDSERDYQAVLTSAWASAVVGLGMGRPSVERGVKVLLIGEEFDTDYIFKLDPKAAGFELTSLTTKVARSRNLAPFDLLRLAGSSIEPYWRNVWHEYEAGTRGRRMLGWSRGLRSSLGVALEDPDVERMPSLQVGNVDAFSMEFLRHTAGGMLGVQAIIEAAAVDGQIGIDAAVALLLDTRAGFTERAAHGPRDEARSGAVAEPSLVDAQMTFWGS